MKMSEDISEKLDQPGDQAVNQNSDTGMAEQWQLDQDAETHLFSYAGEVAHLRGIAFADAVTAIIGEHTVMVEFLNSPPGDFIRKREIENEK